MTVSSQKTEIAEFPHLSKNQERAQVLGKLIAELVIGKVGDLVGALSIGVEVEFDGSAWVPGVEVDDLARVAGDSGAGARAFS